MKTKYKGKGYISKDSKCNKKECFVPFSGNGILICRLWELGQCKGIKLKKGENKS